MFKTKSFIKINGCVLLVPYSTVNTKDSAIKTSFRPKKQNTRRKLRKSTFLRYAYPFGGPKGGGVHLTKKII